MSPKFYSFLWVVFAVSVGILWLGNVLTMVAGVVFGFIAFGLVFTGMMCVLPGTVSHPTVIKIKAAVPKIEVEPAIRPAKPSTSHVHYSVALRFH